MNRSKRGGDFLSGINCDGLQDLFPFQDDRVLRTVTTMTTQGENAALGKEDGDGVDGKGDKKHSLVDVLLYCKRTPPDRGLSWLSAESALTDTDDDDEHDDNHLATGKFDGSAVKTEKQKQGRETSETDVYKEPNHVLSPQNAKTDRPARLTSSSKRRNVMIRSRTYNPNWTHHYCQGDVGSSEKSPPPWRWSTGGLRDTGLKFPSRSLQDGSSVDGSSEEALSYLDASLFLLDGTTCSTNGKSNDAVKFEIRKQSITKACRRQNDRSGRFLRRNKTFS